MYKSNPRRRLYLSLAGLTLFLVATIGILGYFWFDRSTDDRSQASNNISCVTGPTIALGDRLPTYPVFATLAQCIQERELMTNDQLPDVCDSSRQTYCNSETVCVNDECVRGGMCGTVDQEAGKCDYQAYAFPDGIDTCQQLQLSEKFIVDLYEHVAADEDSANTCELLSRSREGLSCNEEDVVYCDESSTSVCVKGTCQRGVACLVPDRVQDVCKIVGVPGATSCSDEGLDEHFELSDNLGCGEALKIGTTITCFTPQVSGNRCDDVTLTVTADKKECRDFGLEYFSPEPGGEGSIACEEYVANSNIVCSPGGNECGVGLVCNQAGSCVQGAYCGEANQQTQVCDIVPVVFDTEIRSCQDDGKYELNDTELTACSARARNELACLEPEIRESHDANNISLIARCGTVIKPISANAVTCEEHGVYDYITGYETCVAEARAMIESGQSQASGGSDEDNSPVAIVSVTSNDTSSGSEEAVNGSAGTANQQNRELTPVEAITRAVNPRNWPNIFAELFSLITNL